MFRIEKEFHFEAAHQLVGHDGPCASLHGHSYRGWVVLESEDLLPDGPQAGMVMDFGRIKAVIEPTIDELLDHRHLNDTLTALAGQTTAERIAALLYWLWKPKLPCLVAVRIEETETSSVEYTP